MKKRFSKSWKSSKQPQKQRKYLANAPLHIRKKFVSVNLSKDLRKKYGKRKIPIRKGDVVKIMRGKFRNKQGKVKEVKLKISKIVVEGIHVKKQDGSKAHVKLQPSNLQIIELNLEDKKRMKKLGVKTESKKEIKKDDKKTEKKTKEKLNKSKIKK